MSIMDFEGSVICVQYLSPYIQLTIARIIDIKFWLMNGVECSNETFFKYNLDINTCYRLIKMVRQIPPTPFTASVNGVGEDILA